MCQGMVEQQAAVAVLTGQARAGGMSHTDAAMVIELVAGKSRW